MERRNPRRNMGSMHRVLPTLLALTLLTPTLAQTPIVDGLNIGTSTTATAVAERCPVPASPMDPVLRLENARAPDLRAARSLRETLREISQSGGVPIEGLWKAGDGAEALDPERMVELHIPAASCAEALDAISDALSMDGEPVRWQRCRGGVELGRRPRLWRSSALSVRAYDVRDLLLRKPAFLAAGVPAPAGGGAGSGGNGGNGGGGNGGSGVVVDPNAAAEQAAKRDDLITLIQLTVEPEAWQSAGGPCTLVPHDGLIVVRAPDFVHRQIESPAPRARPRPKPSPAGAP